MKHGKKSKPTPGSSKGDTLLTVCRLLNEAGAQYLLIGAWAANLHGLLRATRDIDLLIPKGDVANTEKVLHALRQLTFGIAGELESEEIANKPFTIIGDIPRVDLVTVANRVTYQKAAATALETRIQKVRIPYVDYETLIETKKTDRLQDRADIERLNRIHRRKK